MSKKKSAAPEALRPATRPRKKSATPQRKRVSLKGRNTRDHVLKRSAELFAEQGYAALGLQDLAAACELSKGALFAHFDSKRHIYVECVKRSFSNALDSYGPPRAGDTPKQRLRHYLNWICKTMSSNPILPKLILRMVLDKDVQLAREIFPGSFSRTHEVLLSLLRDLKTKKDPESLAFYLYAILTLNDELLQFFEIWTTISGRGNASGLTKTPEHLEALVLSW